MIQLPGGDLWSPPTFDGEGNIVPRVDNVSTADLPVRAKMSPDAMAILMAELERNKAVAK